MFLESTWSDYTDGLMDRTYYMLKLKFLNQMYGGRAAAKRFCAITQKPL